MSKGPLMTIHQIWAKSEGTSTIQTYQCFGTFFKTHQLNIYTTTELLTTLYSDSRLLQHKVPSPRVHWRQFTRFGQNLKVRRRFRPINASEQLVTTLYPDSRLLQHKVRSPRVHSRQFTRFGQNQKLIIYTTTELVTTLYSDSRLLQHKVPSPRVHSRQFTRFGQNLK
eukprot:scaffold12850_cov71-Cylindrotheca_fusiformis.AAC.1